MSAPSRSIVLIGFMGAGKSSVGRSLERRLLWPLCDTDEMIAEQFRMPVGQVFTELGEERFRDVETEVLKTIASHVRSIIVTGGGSILRDANAALLRRLGTVVWLRADEETLFERVSRGEPRPLLQTADPRCTLSTMLKQREPIYRAAADIIVETNNCTDDEAADEILRRVAWK